MPISIFDIGLVVLIAAALGGISKLLRQPIVLAYLLTGVIIGYFRLLNFDNQDVFRVFSDLGIMFLLFLVGLEIDYKSLKRVGTTSLIVGVLQVLITTGIGFFIAQLFSFSAIQSAYLAIAFTFSSTVIVVKLLSEKKDLHSLYGKITIGILLVQDFIAILILVVLAGLQRGEGIQLTTIAFTAAKGVALFFAMLWLGRKALPYLFDAVARSRELLFLISLAWVFLLAAVVQRIGFSIEIAGFLAGVALANSAEHYQISAHMRPLRDFFVLIFFVILGSSLVFSNLSGLTVPLAAFSLFVIIGNPLIVLILMGLLGYKKRTSFLTGLAVGQISEFSLVLAAMGLRVGHITSDVASLITGVGVITITVSSYLVSNSDSIFRAFSRGLTVFERRRTKEDGRYDRDIAKPVVLIGVHRTGLSIAHSIPQEDLLVVDYDPDVVHKMEEEGYDYIFGDIADPEVFERAQIAQAKLVISTSPEHEDNLALLHEIKHLATRPRVIVRAESEAEAHAFYEAGADYVLLPHFTSGQYLGKTIALDPEMRILNHLKKRDLELLKNHRSA